MYVYRFLALLLICAVMGVSVDSASILAIIPSPSKSHAIYHGALTRELAARGHHVTVISSYPQENPPENFTDIAVPVNRFGMDQKNFFERSTWDMLKTITFLGSTLCDHYLGDHGVQKLINSTNKTFDLIIIEVLFNECLLGFVHKYQVPVIGTSALVGAPHLYDIVGSPVPYSHVPNFINGYTDRMTFKERLINTLSTAASHVWIKFIMLPQHDSKMRKYFSKYEPIPYIGEIQSRTSMMFFNSHFSIDLARPYMPNVIEIGGMHIRESKKLPKDIQTFLDSANDGAILFSLGSNLKISQMSEDKIKAMVTVFAQLKQKVLWKSDLESIDGLPPNVKLGTWLPQPDILSHSNVKLFITHGGLLSLQEAMYHQVPLVGIPICADQQMNVRNAVTHGYAVHVDYENITVASMTWALKTILNDPSYEKNVQKISTQFRDQPTMPLERAVFWTEYVMRHGGAHHMRSAAMDLAWYQYFLLDVLVLFSPVLVLASLLVYKLVKTIAGKLRSKTLCSKNPDSNEKKIK